MSTFSYGARWGGLIDFDHLKKKTGVLKEFVSAIGDFSRVHFVQGRKNHDSHIRDRI